MSLLKRPLVPARQYPWVGQAGPCCPHLGYLAAEGLLASELLFTKQKHFLDPAFLPLHFPVPTTLLCVWSELEKATRRLRNPQKL